MVTSDENLGIFTILVAGRGGDSWKWTMLQLAWLRQPAPSSGDPAHVSVPGMHRIAGLLKRWILGTHMVVHNRLRVEELAVYPVINIYIALAVTLYFRYLIVIIFPSPSSRKSEP